MTDKPLSARARRALIALVFHPDATTNRVIHERFGFKIEATERNELDGRGFITWTRAAHNAYAHQLTDAGLRRCRTELSAEAPDGATPTDRILYATWQLVARTLPDSLPELRSYIGVPPPSLPDRILATYRNLVSRPGGTVSLSDLRKHLDVTDRGEVDRTLIDMDRQRRIQLEPDPDRAALTAEARDAAVVLSGQQMHLILVSDR
ncbi:hypothetical protein [Catenuloplanes atrovinosus]|uniref:Uncharacterized protein n=1 Tax=Catenuloplanes atrovinosus TaxID=137266 RepID=A0AAE3YTM5_9ACTN|nr:hypothetical protein [Catenuloplanes atrovinosus]MDR7278425.1 hypothetical protein [Catenuloplanes atrovinosus]